MRRDVNHLHGHAHGSFDNHIPGKVVVSTEQLGDVVLPVISMAEKIEYGFLNRGELIALGISKSRMHNWLELGRFLPIAKLENSGNNGPYLYRFEHIQEVLTKWDPDFVLKTTP